MNEKCMLIKISEFLMTTSDKIAVIKEMMNFKKLIKLF
jgi:hypothetical protein